METEIKEESKVDRLVSNVVECMETRFDLVQLNVQDKVSDIMASMASLVLVGLMLSFTLLMLSIGAAMYISQYYHSAFIGFVYVAAFYLALAALLYLNRKWLIRLPVINLLLKKINFNEAN